MDYTLWQLPTTEESALAFFQEHSIIHKERFCSRNHTMKLYFFNNGSPKWRCNLDLCKESNGLRTNTWFAGSRIPLLTAVRFIYCWSQELTSIEFCELQLSMNHNTTVDWNNYMREVCANALLSRPSSKIGGDDKTVDIIESIFTRRKNNGQVLPPQSVLGGLCRDTKECFLVSVPNRSARALMTAIENNIEDGTVIITDCWQNYDTDELFDAGYEHYTANHRYNFVDSETGCNGKSNKKISSKWGNKRPHHTSHHHLESHLIVFMWRSLYPKTQIFTKILSEISKFMPPS